MIEQPVKIHFPSLPFEPKIQYFSIRQIETPLISSESNESSEEEYDKSNNDIICSNIIGTLNNISVNTNSHSILRKKKTTVKMSEIAQNFQFSFYKIFTTRKKFPKKYVVLIHNEICFNLNLRRVNRDETRSIYLYFVNFSSHAEKILLYIKNHKSEIIRRHPELNGILN